MHTHTYYRLHRRTLILALIVAAALLAVGVMVVSAVDPFPGLPNDGRINVVHHFGGDALYCMDSGVPTDDFDATDSMRLLSINGTELWSVPIADIEAAIADAEATPGVAVLVFSGPGSYGPASLYVTLDPNGDLTFTFVAYDEWGKANAMTFKGCGPVGPIPGGAISSSTCGEIGDDGFCSCAVDFCMAAIGCTTGDSDDETDANACTPDDFDQCMRENFGATIDTCDVD